MGIWSNFKARDYSELFLGHFIPFLVDLCNLGGSFISKLQWKTCLSSPRTSARMQASALPGNWPVIFHLPSCCQLLGNASFPSFSSGLIMALPPHKYMSMSWYPDLGNVFLLGKRVFGDVIKDLEVWFSGRALNPMIYVLLRQTEEDTDTEEKVTWRQRQRLEW